jgi:hypothetical protein
MRSPSYDRRVSDDPDLGAPAPGPEPSHPRPSSRPFRWFVTGVAAALLAVAGLVAVRGGGPDLLGTATAPTASSDARSPASGAQPGGRAAITPERRAAVAGLLDERARALLDHDRAAFLATVDSRTPGLRARQRTWFDNLSDVPLASWHHEISGAAPPPTNRSGLLGPDAFTAAVRVGYRLSGHDRAPQLFEQVLTFDRRDGRWLVAGDPDPGADGAAARAQPRQLWDFGAVRAVTTQYGLVLGLGSRERLRAYGREVDRAVPKVLDVWRGQWSGRVVLVVPRTEDQLAALLGGRPSQYVQLAAITRGELGTTEDSAPADRVFINPAAFGKLSAVGRRVIMAHEITHVASRASTQRWTPKWLSEGLADYVGYRDSGLATRVVAQELAADVRRGRLPYALPDDDAFWTTRKDLPQVYEQSWLACRLIVERYGEQALTRFYRAVGDGPEGQAVERAFRDLLGTTQAEFTGAWRDYVRRQLQ